MTVYILNCEYKIRLFSFHFFALGGFISTNKCSLDYSLTDFEVRDKETNFCHFVLPRPKNKTFIFIKKSVEFNGLNAITQLSIKFLKLGYYNFPKCLYIICCYFVDVYIVTVAHKSIFYLLKMVVFCCTQSSLGWIKRVMPFSPRHWSCV